MPPGRPRRRTASPLRTARSTAGDACGRPGQLDHRRPVVGLRAAPGGSGWALKRSNGSDSLPQVSGGVGAAAVDRRPCPGSPSPSAPGCGVERKLRRIEPAELLAQPGELRESSAGRLCRILGQRRGQFAQRLGSVGSLPPLSSRCRFDGRAGEQAALRELFERARSVPRGGLGSDHRAPPPGAAAA